ncbi:MAG: hypothetical protein ABWY58_16015 [Aeromicrobium sp.]
MSQPLRIICASILLAIAAWGLVVVASQITTTYYLPPGASGVATKHTAAFEPAVTGTVVASVAAIALLSHLVVVVLRRQAARWTWIAAAACTLVAVGAPVVVATLDRPVF